MNNIKAIILSVVSVVTINVNAIDILPYLETGVDEEGNTLLHKVAQSCHEPDRFSLDLSIRPMQWVDQNASSEKAIVLITLVNALTDQQNAQFYFDQGEFALTQAINTNPKLCALAEKIMNAKEDENLAQKKMVNMLAIKNNHGQMAVDIFREQMNNHPKAEWCTILGIPLVIYEAVEEARKKLEKIEKETANTVKDTEEVMLEQR